MYTSVTLRFGLYSGLVLLLCFGYSEVAQYNGVQGLAAHAWIVLEISLPDSKQPLCM